MVQETARRKQHGAAVEVQLAQVPAVFGGEGPNIGVRYDTAMPPSKDELTACEEAESKHAQTFRSCRGEPGYH